MGGQGAMHNTYTMCPRSSDPFYIVFLMYKMGHYFLDVQYVGFGGRNIAKEYSTEYWCQTLEVARVLH